jgi:DNA-binding GntR family transcriptional regulator
MTNPAKPRRTVAVRKNSQRALSGELPARASGHAPEGAVRPIKPARQARTSLSTTTIYQRLREMATRFEFRPGERINEVALCEYLKVSRTPVREVLNQLYVEGFFEREANRGFVGRPLDVGEVFDLYEFRLGVECAVARLACQRATDAEIDALEGMLAQSVVMPETSDPAELVALDERFHMALAALCRNAEYIRTLSNINARVHYVRWIDMREGRRPHTQGEHGAIVAALRRRDADAMVSMLTEHISRRREQITETIKLGFAEIYMRPTSSA